MFQEYTVIINPEEGEIKETHGHNGKTSFMIFYSYICTFSKWNV